MLNRVQLFGYFGHDPELKIDKTGKQYTTFFLLVPRKVKVGNRRIYDDLKVKAWKSTAENVCKFFSKGSGAIVDGALRTQKNEETKTKEIYVNAEYVISPVENRWGESALGTLSKISYEELIEGEEGSLNGPDL